MSENPPQSDSVPIPEKLTPEGSNFSPIPFNIAEEYGTAKKNLPPAKIVLLAIAVLAVVAAVSVLVQRPQSAVTGSVTGVVSVDVPDQNTVMVAMNVSLHNRSQSRYWIKTIQAALDTTDAHLTDDAASAVDFDRYFQAFPALKQHALTPLITEVKIGAGDTLSGTVIVSFPVTAEVFNRRKTLTLTIQPYDGVSLILAQ